MKQQTEQIKLQPKQMQKLQQHMKQHTDQMQQLERETRERELQVARSASSSTPPCRARLLPEDRPTKKTSSTTKR